MSWIGLKFGLEPWEENSYREQKESNMNICEWCSEECEHHLLYETDDGEVLCRECYNTYLEEKEKENE
ncbi:MAG TPA: hypothetical protein ENN33_07095 [Ignavibacteria bacterium]|nr:hypothetical protein [Ignavibacteria bacterium]